MRPISLPPLLLRHASLQPNHRCVRQSLFVNRGGGGGVLVLVLCVFLVSQCFLGGPRFLGFGNRRPPIFFLGFVHPRNIRSSQDPSLDLPETQTEAWKPMDFFLTFLTFGSCVCLPPEKLWTSYQLRVPCLFYFTERESFAALEMMFRTMKVRSQQHLLRDDFVGHGVDDVHQRCQSFGASTSLGPQSRLVEIGWPGWRIWKGTRSQISRINRDVL